MPVNTVLMFLINCSFPLISLYSHAYITCCYFILFVSIYYSEYDIYQFN